MAIKLKEIKPGMVIHCKTQEEANKLVEFGILDISFGGEDHYWNVYREDTCYYYCSFYKLSYTSWLYGHYDSFKNEGRCVTEFEDLIIKDEEEESETMDYNITKEQLDDSLKIIRLACIHFGGDPEKGEELDCTHCPLRWRDGGCSLDHNTPRRWVLKSDKKDNRLFD